MNFLDCLKKVLGVFKFILQLQHNEGIIEKCISVENCETFIIDKCLFFETKIESY